MIAPVIIATAAILISSLPGISAMKWERRVLLVCAPNEDDPSLIKQRRLMASWQDGADERNLAVVEIVGDRVVGSSDPAGTLRREYRLRSEAFVVILIGKDGGIKLRQAAPISAATLENTIDAMPMARGANRGDQAEWVGPLSEPYLCS